MAAPPPARQGERDSQTIVEWDIASAVGAWLLFRVLAIGAEPRAIPAWTVRVLQVTLGLGLRVTPVAEWHHDDDGRQRVSGPGEHHG